MTASDAQKSDLSYLISMFGLCRWRLSALQPQVRPRPNLILSCLSFCPDGKIATSAACAMLSLGAVLG